ncbi:MarR family winged helix-turn-helix transcriptional regulator [Streptomyces heilongjiangensis]|uniref:MarR family winged helix-turn-helix transcriptional regulator n=1 Tax=Streptomyces heilongjiangensis TaxID=945052 RepID=A0ABW1BAT3_9ACTN|nr:MarR family transcriptional regulator [Streptomyces heilongjiangensis]MDC2950545.1 MarR family transcriptional regulator [Streptomyces heilongjiangensis]
MPSEDQQIETTERIMYLLNRIRVQTAEVVASDLSDLGLTGTQALILETLLERGPTSAAELGRRCLITRQALSAPLNALEQRGLVSRPRSDASARQRPSSLTDRGREVAASVRRRVLQLERGSVQSFTAEERATLEQLLRRYADFWSGQAGSPTTSAEAESAGRGLT